MFRELRDVFRLMNHKDQEQNFQREIKLFEKCIIRLEELYQNPNASARSVVNDKEGGNFENNRKNSFKDFKYKEVQSDASSDITQKPVKEIRVDSDKQISIRKLQKGSQGNCLTSLCRCLASCFSCFNSSQDTSRSLSDA